MTSIDLRIHRWGRDVGSGHLEVVVVGGHGLMSVDARYKRAPVGEAGQVAYPESITAARSVTCGGAYPDQGNTRPWRWVTVDGHLVTAPVAELLNELTVESDIPPGPFQLYRVAPAEGLPVRWQIGAKACVGVVDGHAPHIERIRVRTDDGAMDLLDAHLVCPA